MKKETLKDMIKYSPDNLNIFWNERRCILLALMKTNFKISKAWLINAPEIPLASYKRKFYRHDLKLRILKQEYLSMTKKQTK